MKNGIDISYYQDNIDYDKLAKAVDFVIIRIGRWLKDRDEPYKDSMFEEHYKQLKARNVPVGAYWYCYASTPERAKEEADWCYKWIKDKQFEYPIFLDIEEKFQERMGDCSKIAEAFLDPLEKRGYFVGLYSYNSFILNNINKETRSKYALWIARTPKEDNGWTKIGPSISCLMHQWTFKRVNFECGIKSTDLDRDICFRDDIPELIKEKGLNGFGKVGDIPDLKQKSVKVYNLVVDEYETNKDAYAALAEVKKTYPNAKVKVTTKKVLTAE